MVNQISQQQKSQERQNINVFLSESYIPHFGFCFLLSIVSFTEGNAFGNSFMSLVYF